MAMRILRRTGTILILLAVVSPYAWASRNSAIAITLLRQRIQNSVGKLPWRPAEGYGLAGRFVLKATGEEIHYKARLARAPNRLAADFSAPDISGEDGSRNLRYVFSEKRAWVSSPEITADAPLELIPYMARLDFPQLYDDLIRILERGMQDPAFGVGTVTNQIHIKGKLQNGWIATFVLNTVEYFPRRILITTADKPSAAWLLPFARPDGSCSLLPVPGTSPEFEILLSDPVDADGYRYARRMDFAEHGSIVGTFFQEESFANSEAEALFNRPAQFPWAGSLNFQSRTGLRKSSLYLNPSELPAFRSRIEEHPWSLWNRENRLISFWAIVVLGTGPLFPQSISFRVTYWAVTILFLALVFLLLRRRRQTTDAFRWGLLIGGLFLGCLILMGWIASHQFHSPRDRSLIALHCSIRHAATGYKLYAWTADALLRNFQNETPAQSIEDLGDSCQAYALAYDLIRSTLTSERRKEFERDLFLYAKPLFGASRGWNSSMPNSSVISAGLGMAGLAIGYEPYVTAAREVMDKMLKAQIVGGLHQAGPGRGSDAMNSAVNFFYAMKHTGRADYFSSDSFRQYTHATLQMLSPLGTLPLFGDTNLDQSARLSAFFLKIANQVPIDEGRQCIAAHNLYWAHGRYYAQGWIKWVRPLFQPLMMCFQNPYILLQYTQAIPASSPPASSAVTGDGQAAVLRAGSDPDSAYLALNMTRSYQAAHRDILTFDMYAYRSLVLHGPGFPGQDRPGYRESEQTAAANSITMNDENQSATQCTGIDSSLLNQPVFDYVRALADKTYDYGQVERSVIMVRPEQDHPAYYVLFDDVLVSDDETTVQWYLHGRGNLVTGIDQVSRWTSVSIEAPQLRQNTVILEAAHPTGDPGRLFKKAGILYSESSRLNQNSMISVIEWNGSRRFCTVLSPRKSNQPQVKIEKLDKNIYRIGAADWICMGSQTARAAKGPLTLVGDYAIVRDRGQSFPAVLMISGLTCGFGPHSIFSTKPLTASLKGLSGGFLNSRPDTRVELRSPEIRAGGQFRLDGQSIAAAESGLLVFTLSQAGEHSLLFAR
jgi:hypothetical protein